MKANPKIPIDKYIPLESHTVIMDTNILINLFYPINFSSDADKIDVLFKNLIQSKCKLIISAIQISEFVNRCIRIQFNLYNEVNPNSDYKKDYRNTDDYKDNMKAIIDIIKTDIMQSFIIIDDGFSMMKYERIFLYGFSYDFNDALIVEIARNHKAIVITNDKDYANYGNDFPIVTNNNFLLKLR